MKTKGKGTEEWISATYNALKEIEENKRIF